MAVFGQVRDGEKNLGRETIGADAADPRGEDHGSVGASGYRTCPTLILQPNIPRSLLRGQNCWGFQRGLNIPLALSGVHAPIAKCPVDGSPSSVQLEGIDTGNLTRIESRNPTSRPARLIRLPTRLAIGQVPIVGGRIL